MRLFSTLLPITLNDRVWVLRGWEPDRGAQANLAHSLSRVSPYVAGESAGELAPRL